MIFECITRDHCFSLDLIVVLQCLAICERQGHVPRIEGLWWQTIETSYPDISFSFDTMKNVTHETDSLCELDDEPVMFNIVNEQGDIFILDLESILAILEAAEDDKQLSALPGNWWLTTQHRYSTS